MASKRKLRSAGSTIDQSLDAAKKYTYNSSGTLVETTTPGDNDVVFSGSSSNLRRIADLERNVSILAAKALTTDATTDGSSVTRAEKADKWTSARTLSLTGAVTGSVSIDGAGNVSLATTATSDPTITLTGAVTGTGTMTNLGNVSITTTATADPTLTLAGDASGSATFTNLGNATLTVTVADDSHNHIISNVDGLQAALDAKADSSMVGDGVLEIAPGDGLMGGGFFNANSYVPGTITLSHADTSSVGNVDNSGNTFIQDLTFDTYGHVLSVASAGWNNAVSITGNAATATNASYVYVEDDNTTNANRYITFVDDSTAGNKRLNEDTGLYYNPSTNGLFVAGEVTAYASDAQLKTNVVAIESPLAKLEAIRGVTYNWNEKGQEFGLGTAEQVGVIAQEVEAVLPQLVTQSAIEGYKTVKYDKLTALLIEAVKELSAEVKTLKAELGKTSL